VRGDLPETKKIVALAMKIEPKREPTAALAE
jgi:hypothetical protein